MHDTALVICDPRSKYVGQWFPSHCINQSHLEHPGQHLIDYTNRFRLPLNGHLKILNPLIVPSFLGLTILVQHLLQQDTRHLNEGDKRYKRTPLSWAAMEGHTDVVKLLLRQEGIQINTKDTRYQTALHLAGHYGHFETVELLLQRPDLKIDGPILWLAIAKKDPVLFELLLKFETADINHRDKTGLTPLNWVISHGDPMLVRKILVFKDLDPNILNPCHEPPLLSAVKNGHTAIVKLLLDAKGINAEAKDLHGTTPLNWAEREGPPEILHLLETKLKRPCHCDNDLFRRFAKKPPGRVEGYLQEERLVEHLSRIFRESNVLQLPKQSDGKRSRHSDNEEPRSMPKKRRF